MSVHDPETGEVIERVQVSRLIGNDGEFGAVAILKDGRTIALRVSLRRAMEALGIDRKERKPITFMTKGLQKR